MSRIRDPISFCLQTTGQHTNMKRWSTANAPETGVVVACDAPEPSEKQGPIQCGRPAQADRRTGARCGPQSPGLAVKTPAQAVPHSLHRPSGDRVHWSIA